MQLRDYQQKIKDFILTNKRCNIFVKCGMGKTFSTLAALSELKNIDRKSFPILVVAPKRVAQNEWAEQAEKAGITNLVFQKILGDEQQRIKALKTKANVYLINYEMIDWLITTMNERFPFKTVVCDESTKIKNHKGSNSRVSKNSINATRLVQQADIVKRWINLSGTPNINTIAHLWSQQYPIDFGKALGPTYTYFAEKYFNVKRYNFVITKLIPRPNSAELIMKAIKPNTLLVLNDLKEHITIDVPIEFPEKLAKHYKKLEDSKVISIKKADDEVADAEDLTGMKMRQFCSGTIISDDGEKIKIHSLKIKKLLELLKKLDTNVIITYFFQHDADEIIKAIPDAVRLDKGGVQAIADWNAGKIKTLLLHPKSAAHGLNLQYGGNVMIVFTPDWDSETYVQAIERIGQARQKSAGFDRDTYIYRIYIKDSIDEIILKSINKKIKLSAQDELHLL